MRVPFSDDAVHYAGQYVALVVAKTIEQARHAASLVRVTYAPEDPLLTMEDAEHKAVKPKKNLGDNVQIKKGDVDIALQDSNLVKIEQTYTTPTETHNPIEMSGTIAAWEADDKLTLYDATQFVKGVQSVLAGTWNLAPDNVRVICPFVGGAFGCKGAVWPHVFVAAIGINLAQGRTPDCHCFGDTGTRLTAGHLVRNALLSMAAVGAGCSTWLATDASSDIAATALSVLIGGLGALLIVFWDQLAALIRELAMPTKGDG